MSGNSYLRYEKAKASRYYAALVEKAIDRLEQYGNFSKSEVLGDTDFDVVDENTFRWDYIKRMVEEDRDTELIPLAMSFFRQRNPEMIMAFPRKYIALGHGKKCAGYCIATERNGHFVIEQLDIKTGRANGMIKSRERTRRIGSQGGVRGLGRSAAKLLPRVAKG